MELFQCPVSQIKALFQFCLS